jgi:MscS family membrane protein
MENRNRLSRAALLLCLGTLPAWAQLPSLPGLSPAGTQKLVDRLGRDNPRSALMGFLRVAQRAEWQIASEYLELSTAEQRRRGPELARELREILDAGFAGDLDRISADPRGSVEEGMAEDEEDAGTLAVRQRRVSLILRSVKSEAGTPVWLVSRRTLDHVPDLYSLIGFPAVEERLPAFLVRVEVLSFSLWKWIALILLFPVLVALGWLATEVILAPSKIRRRLGHQPLIGLTWQKPVSLLIALSAHAWLATFLGFPLLYRQYYYRLITVLVFLAAGWLLLTWIEVGASRFQRRLLAAGQTAMQSLFPLSRRILKALVVIVIGLLILKSLGANLSVALTGLGIGGLAVALAAQKTIENLFGGISVLSDKSIQVGDVCRLGEHVGQVEDIGLRSTAVRALDRRLIYVPNGVLAAMQLENLSRRDKFWFHHVIGLRYETSPSQLRYVLAELRLLLEQHPKVERGTHRVRFLRFGAYSLDAEVFAYIFIADYLEFLSVQEDLLLSIMDIVSASGTGLAFPSQTTYTAPDAGLDPSKRKAAEEEVERWRREGVTATGSGPRPGAS